MIGLKTYLPSLSLLVGITHQALYERQRALVRCGALSSVAGKGPGSGVKADAEALATFLISLLSHELLVEAENAEAFGRLRNEESKCPLTGANDLKGALVKILSDHYLAERTSSVTVHRDEKSAVILGKTGHKIITSRFLNRGKNLGGKWLPEREVELRTTVSITSKLMAHVANDLAKIEGLKL
jgi:hypothetical protein